MADISTEPFGLPDISGEELNGAPDVLTSRKASMEPPRRPGEDETVEWVEGLWDEADRGKRDQCTPDTWPDDLAIYWGDMWPGQVPTYKPRIVVNEIKSLVLQEISDLTDSRINFYVQKKPEAPERDEMVETAMKRAWKNNFWDLEILQASLDAMIFPLGFIQRGWDWRLEQGQGDVVLRHRDPATVYPDPDALGDNDLAYMILEDVLDLRQIKRDWPETGWRVQPEASYSEKLGDKEGSAKRAASGYVGPLYTRTGQSGVPGYKKARARLLTVTVDDDERVHEINMVQGRLRESTRLRYPHTRMIQVANRRVLYDDDCPYWYAPMLTRVALQPSVHSYWPQVSVVGEYGEIQSTANKMDSMVAENMLRLNAGLGFADADSGIKAGTWSPVPGLMTLVKPGSKVFFQNGVPMPAEMVQSGERFRGFIRSEMGFPLSRTGAGTHGNVAAELAETEISQAMGLTRLRGRLMYQAVQRIASMVFATMAQFYTTPRHLTYIEQGQLKGIKWTPIVNPEEYVVHVDEDSFSVKSKSMVQRVALALAKMNKMPTGRLLKILEVPDADAIADELKQELMLQAAAKGKLQMQQKGKRG
jgi:hypothetical protein